MARWFRWFSIFCLISPAARAWPELAVVSKQDGVLQIFDVRTGQLQREYPLGYLPHEVLVSPRGGHIAVTNYGKDHVRSEASTNVPGKSITIIRGAEVADAIDDDLDKNVCAPHGMAESRDGRRLYVTCEAQRSVIVYDVPSGRVLRRIATDQDGSHMVAVNADETRAYTSNFQSGSVTAIDLRTGRIIAQIPVGPGTEGLSLSPDGNFVYATSVLGNFIAKIDANRLRVIATSAAPRSPVRILPTPDGQKLIVNSSADNCTTAFRAADLSVEWSLDVGRQPIGLAVPNDATAFVAAMRDDRIVEVDLKTGKIIKSFVTARKPDGIDIVPY